MTKTILGAGLLMLTLTGTAPEGAAAQVPAAPGAVSAPDTAPAAGPADPAATLAGPVKGTADPTVAIRKALQALYDSQDAALERGDVPRAMAGYAPGYAAVGQDGSRHTRDEEFDALERVRAVDPSLRQHSHIGKIITHNGQASLVLRRQTTLGLLSPNTHQRLVLRTEAVSQELWVHTTLGWKLTFSKTVRQRSSVGTGTGPGGDSPGPARQAAARPRRALSAGRPASPPMALLAPQ